VVGRPQRVASDSEKILNDSVHRPESLRLSHGCKPSHLSLTLSDRFIRDFSPIVGVALCVVQDRRHVGLARCLIGPHLVGDQSPGFPFQTEDLGLGLEDGHKFLPQEKIVWEAGAGHQFWCLQGPTYEESQLFQVTALLATLRETEVIPTLRLPLLSKSTDGSENRLSLIRAQLLFVQEHDDSIYSRRMKELAYLANVLMAGCSFQLRRFRAMEATLLSVLISLDKRSS
jgi:hypothetical protein